MCSDSNLEALVFSFAYTNTWKVHWDECVLEYGIRKVNENNERNSFRFQRIHKIASK